jgi:hypothetical protein
MVRAVAAAVSGLSCEQKKTYRKTVCSAAGSGAARPNYAAAGTPVSGALVPRRT